MITQTLTLIENENTNEMQYNNLVKAQNKRQLLFAKKKRKKKVTLVT